MPMSPSSAASGRVVLAKALDVLFAFDEKHPELTVQEIAERVEQPKSTVYRYLALLAEKGLLERGSAEHRYRLGLRILELSRLVRQQLSLADLALPVMREIAAASEETVMLAIPEKARVICVEQVESHQSLRVSFARGMTFPFHASSPSKALLAFQEPAFVEQILAGELERYTDRTVTDRERLKEELHEIRANGYCVVWGELASSITGNPAPIAGVSAAIIDPRGYGVASLNICLPSFRLTPECTESLIRLVRDGASRISQLVD